MPVQTECKVTKGKWLGYIELLRARYGPSALANAFSTRATADGRVQRQTVGLTVVRDEIEKTLSKVRQFALPDTAHGEQRAG